MTSDGRWNYAWDAENRLISMTATATAPVPAKRRLEFIYDYIGKRIQKKFYVWNSTTSAYQLQMIARFLYDGWDLVAELDGSNAAIRTNVRRSNCAQAFLTVYAKAVIEVFGADQFDSWGFLGFKQFNYYMLKNKPSGGRPGDMLVGNRGYLANYPGYREVTRRRSWTNQAGPWIVKTSSRSAADVIGVSLKRRPLTRASNP